MLNWRSYRGFLFLLKGALIFYKPNKKQSVALLFTEVSRWLLLNTRLSRICSNPVSLFRDNAEMVMLAENKILHVDNEYINVSVFI